MARRAAAGLVVVALLAGCGGGGGSGSGSSGSANTPKGTVAAFLAAVHDGDWKGACSHLSPNGMAQLGPLLGDLSPQDLNSFGLPRSCPSLLAKRAVVLRHRLEHASPGSTHMLSSKRATVSSAIGDWSVDTMAKAGQWLIAELPVSTN